MSVGVITAKQSATTEVACSVGKLHVHTVDDSVQYIEQKRKIYKFTELKSRNPRILFNPAEVGKPRETTGTKTSRGQPKERDK